MRGVSKLVLLGLLLHIEDLPIRLPQLIPVVVGYRGGIPFLAPRLYAS